MRIPYAFAIFGQLSDCKGLDLKRRVSACWRGTVGGAGCTLMRRGDCHIGGLSDTNLWIGRTQ